VREVDAIKRCSTANGRIDEIAKARMSTVAWQLGVWGGRRVSFDETQVRQSQRL
jgi:hypothetical protein